MTSVVVSLERFGAEVVPFEAHHFGASYPQGNKIALFSNDPNEPGRDG